MTTLRVLERFGRISVASGSSDPIWKQPVIPDGKAPRGTLLERGITNLVTNPSAEVDLTGWSSYLGTGGNGAFSRIAVAGYAVAGTACFRVNNSTTANAGGYGYHGGGSIGVDLVSGQQYVLSVYAKANVAGTGLNLFVDPIGSATFVLTTGWKRYTYTFTAPSTGAFAVYIRSNTPDAIWWFDAVQVEQGAYATSYVDGSLGLGYSWSGTAHASTSSRTGSLLRWNPGYAYLPQGPITITAWARFPQASPFPAYNGRLFEVGDGTSNNRILVAKLNGTNSLGYYRLRAGVEDSNALALGTATQAGDLLFCALTWDGTSLTIRASQNGGAMQKASLASSAAYSTGYSMQYVYAGCSVDVTQWDGPVEQVCVYKRAFTDADFTLAATQVFSAGGVLTGDGNPDDLTTDPDIMFSALTGYSAGPQAASLAGSGDYRLSRSVTGTLQVFQTSVSLPNVTPAATAIFIGTNTGLGVGDVVANGTAVPGGYSTFGTYQVVYTETLGGQDYVYLASVAP